VWDRLAVRVAADTGGEVSLVPRETLDRGVRLEGGRAWHLLLACPTMSLELVRQIRRLGHGDHSCLLYDTPDEQQAAVIPFFKEGLLRGERCLYIADDRSVEQVKGFLASAGVDVAAEISRGAFSILTKRETYLKGGAFDPGAMISVLGETLEKTLAQGFIGLRGSGEMTWALGPEEGCSRVIEYEARLNDFFPGKPFLAICQYNRPRFPARTTLDVLRTHHYAVIGGAVCPNLYFEPSAMVLGQSSDDARLEWRISQLKRAREALGALERAVQTREAFFSVASHELRTPLTSLRLQLERSIREVERTHVTTTVTAALKGTIFQVDHLEDLVARLLDVSRLGTEGLRLSRTEVDMEAVVREAASRHAARADIARCPLRLELQSVMGCWDRARLARAIDNLLLNAFKYGARKPVHVGVQRAGQSAVLTIRDEGIGISLEDQTRIFGPFERAVSERNYSGFGVGLWIVQQIVHAHSGSIQVDSRPGRGATFVVQLPLTGDDGLGDVAGQPSRETTGAIPA
jgi:signal transduction histidine kinase